MSKEEHKYARRSLNTAFITVLLLLYTMSSCTTTHQVSEARIERKAARKYKLLNNYKNGYYKPYYTRHQSYSEDIYDMRPEKLRQEKPLCHYTSPPHSHYT